ncbi:unnamed protein product [Thelazia callipaeda]|uniref:Uncharacterized protein n=1 Tax=Thelazia callipaeda TaxID=103827 RepID=A0A0N5CP24_THECL|nr:unnamed protein product [Thelazia callipaeda]
MPDNDAEEIEFESDNRRLHLQLGLQVRSKTASCGSSTEMRGAMQSRTRRILSLWYRDKLMEKNHSIFIACDLSIIRIVSRAKSVGTKSSCDGQVKEWNSVGRRETCLNLFPNFTHVISLFAAIFVPHHFGNMLSCSCSAPSHSSPLATLLVPGSLKPNHDRKNLSTTSSNKIEKNLESLTDRRADDDRHGASRNHLFTCHADTPLYCFISFTSNSARELLIIIGKIPDGHIAPSPNSCSLLAFLSVSSLH